MSLEIEEAMGRPQQQQQQVHKISGTDLSASNNWPCPKQSAKKLWRILEHYRRGQGWSSMEKSFYHRNETAVAVPWFGRSNTGITVLWPWSTRDNASPT